MHGDATFLGDIDRSQGGPPIHRRQPAGVAVRQDVHRVASLAPGSLGDQVGAVLADGPAGRHVLLGDGGGLGGGGFGAPGRGEGGDRRGYAPQRPGQIDRRRPRGGQARARLGKAGVRGVGPQSQSQAPRRRHPDQRSAANPHVRDGADRIIQGFQTNDL